MIGRTVASDVQQRNDRVKKKKKIYVGYKKTY